MSLVNSYTSTGIKLYLHQEAMQALRDGKGKPIHGWLAAHDICQHKCTFCSVGEREGDVLSFRIIEKYIHDLADLGLKAMTLSGGGNSILYRCKETGKDFNDLVDLLHSLSIQVGVITNGAAMKKFPCGRTSWKMIRPETLDKMTWCRISMSGIDHNHAEQEVFVPDFNPQITTLGFSWIMSDSYEEPSHKHGWVSTPDDIRTPMDNRKVVYAVDRLPFIESKIREYVDRHNPQYVRFLSNCIEPEKIPERHALLSGMAERINPSVCFSQHKPPRQPLKCWKILPHPCLNADGFLYSCDSVVLNRDAGHKFGSRWRICRADQVRELYEDPSKFKMPDGICPGCVFADQVDLINGIVEQGMPTPYPEGQTFQHENFV